MSGRTVSSTLRAMSQNPNLRKEVLGRLASGASHTQPAQPPNTVTAAGDLFYRELSSAFASQTGMQSQTAQRILAHAALMAPKSASSGSVRLMSTSTNMNMIKSRPNTFFKAEQAVMAPRRPKSSIDMTAADQHYAMPKPTTNNNNNMMKTKMSLMSASSTSTSTTTKTATALPTSAPTKKSEVFRTQRPGFYGLSPIVRDFSTAAPVAPTKPTMTPSLSKVMQQTRPGFYGVSAFRSFSTAAPPTPRNKEFFVGINADWPAQPAPPTMTSDVIIQKTSTKPTDNIDLPEQHPTWRPVDDGKTLSESEARIPQNETERFVTCLP